MTELDIHDLQIKWLEKKLSDPEASITEFLRDKYLWYHCEEEGREEEKSQNFYSLLEQWELTDEKYQTILREYPDDLQLEQWQAAQMLDGVIDAFDMSLDEQYHYLLNVRLLCSYQLMGNNLSDYTALRKTVEQAYEKRWICDKNHITDYEIQELFSETVEIMRYTGLCYNDDTRYVLAQIGAGRNVDFSDISSISAQKDLQLIACFVVSEMVLGDESEQYSEEERKLLLNEVVPVCVSSVVGGADSENPVRTERLALSILAEKVSTKFPSILLTSATVLLAAKVTWSLLSICVSGITFAIGAGSVWNMCKNFRGLQEQDMTNDSYTDDAERNNFREGEADIWNKNEEKAEVKSYV
mgnify:CR=1 FL=1